MKELLIFDLDGTLCDSEKMIHSIWNNYTYTHHGITISNKEWYQHFYGISNKEKARRIANLFSIEVSETDRSELSNLYVKMMEEKGENMLDENIKDIIKAAHPNVCIATNAKLNETMRKIKSLGLEEYFSNFNTFTIDSVKNGKPAPDIYLKAADVMGFDPEACLVVEDSITGITGGKNANMDVIAVGYYRIDHEDFEKEAKKLDVSGVCLSKETLKAALSNFDFKNLPN